MDRSPEGPSPLLAPGTQVGDWRVVERQGQGSYGAVYRALRVGQEDAGPVALKLSLHPGDQRFLREVALLSRLRHPSVPRLLAHGLWRHPSGVEHPYFVMEWVDGTPLYAWAQQQALSSPQFFRLLSQVAHALAALHAANGVHRDVKGDNILVRHSDGRALLIDFGAGHFQGAARLTWQSLPPNTSAYRSSQACVFHIRSVRNRNSYYPPSPADDIFALGVTAYRLVMGEYPPPMEPQEDENGSWQVTSPDPRPFLERNPRVEPRMRELILRMLSAAPEARGTMAALAEALEAAADGRAEVHRPEPLPLPKSVEVAPPKAERPARVEPLPESSRPRARGLAWKPWLALAAAGVSAVLLWTLQSASRQEASNSEAPDAGTAAVGDTPPTVPPASVPQQKALTQDTAPQPRPGQTLPDGKGRCPVPKQVSLNGGCWVEVSSITTEECVQSGYAYVKGRCYAPALAPPKKTLPTSSPTEAR